jgi:hypothetical protein
MLTTDSSLTSTALVATAKVHVAVHSVDTPAASEPLHPAAHDDSPYGQSEYVNSHLIMMVRASTRPC